MAETALFLKVFVALYVLVNPLEGIPIFLARTQGMEDGERRRIARLAALGVTAILLVSLFGGRWLLELLDISIGAFAAAGGVIIFLIALQMVNGGPSDSRPAGKLDAGGAERFALVPLATPLLAGPGAIAGVIVYASKGPGGHGCTPIDYLILAGIIVALGLATWLALLGADRLRRLLGETGIEVSTRISGILVAAIAIGLMQEGLVKLFPVLGR